MSKKQEIAHSEKSATAASNAVLPPVDVFEDESGITLLADLPGVSRDGLHVHVENEMLVIEGTAELAAPEAMEAVYAEAHSPNFARRFTLSRELDAAKVEASMKDGVLKLHIPKAEAAKPHRIQVQVD